MTVNSVVAGSVPESLVPSTSSPQFTPNCYAICQDGHPMPGINHGRNSEGFVDVVSPTGRVYSFRPEAILSVEEVEDHMHQDRVSLVANTYQFRDVEGMPARTVVCSHPTKKTSSYVIVETAGGRVCTCPAFAKSYGQTCKHVEALWLREKKQDDAAARGRVRAQQEAAAREARASKPVRPYVEISAEDW